MLSKEGNINEKIGGTTCRSSNLFIDISLFLFHCSLQIHRGCHAVVEAENPVRSSGTTYWEVKIDFYASQVFIGIIHQSGPTDHSLGYELGYSLCPYHHMTIFADQQICELYSCGFKKQKNGHR